MKSRARVASLFAFLGVTCVGLAVALWLTSVHRSPLPTEEIRALAKETKSDVVWPSPSILVRELAAPGRGLHSQHLAAFAEQLSTQLATQVAAGEAAVPEGSLSLCASASSASHCLSGLEAAGGGDQVLGPEPFELWVLASESNSSALVVGPGTQAVLMLAKDAHPSQVVEEVVQQLQRTWFKPLRLDTKAALFEFAPAFVLSFVLVGDCTKRVSWDFVEKLMKPYLRRFLGRLQKLFELELDSHTVQCGSLASGTEQGEDLVTPKMLQADFLRKTGDWPGDAVVKNARWLPPLIRLAAFAPSHQVELVDELRKPQKSFAVQGWGVMAVLEADGNSSSSLAREQGQEAAKAWVSSLRSWLALPPSHSVDLDSSADPASLQLLVARPKLDGVADWELRLIASALLGVFLTRAAETLENLVMLVESLPDVVVVEELGELAQASMSACRLAAEKALQGDLGSAVALARKALMLALTASHDDTVVAQMYFSWEFKNAVYLPIGLPILLPISVALVRLFRKKAKPLQLPVPVDVS